MTPIKLNQQNTGIQIVEDDAGVITLLKDTLHKWYTVRAAFDVKKAGI